MPSWALESHGRHALADVSDHRGGGGGTLIVSRGIGGIEVPVRSFADPDILVVTLNGAGVT